MSPPKIVPRGSRWRAIDDGVTIMESVARGAPGLRVVEFNPDGKAWRIGAAANTSTVSDSPSTARPKGMSTKSLCVLRFEDVSFERDLRGTLDDLVAGGWQVSVHRLGDEGALLECRRPNVKDAAPRRDLGLAGAITRVAFDTAGAEPDWIDRCCAVSAAVDLARTREDAEVGVAFRVLRRIQSRLERRGWNSRAQVIALVINALSSCDRWVLS